MQQESLPLRTTDEGAFALALEDKKVKDAPLEDLKEVLRMAMVKVGLRAENWPEGEEKDVLHNHIIENYGNHTAAEIRLAFEMGLANKLPFKDNESIVPYENFSCMYFSSVMNAYREWAKNAKNFYDKNFWKQVQENDKPTESMSDKTYLDWYEQTAKDYRSGQLKFAFLPATIADWLIQRGRIDPQEYYVKACVDIGKRLAAEGAEDRQAREDYREYKEQYKRAAKTNQPFTGKWPAKIEYLAKMLAFEGHILNNMIP